MKHTYKIDGMSCQSCVGKVQKAIGDVEGIKAVEVNLAEQQAEITMDHHVSLSTLRGALTAAGDYQISQSDAPAAQNGTPDAHHHEPQKSGLAVYKPLLLVVGYITGISLLVSLAGGAFDGMLFMRSFMAGFFLTFSFFKMLDLEGFASSYASYDILARRWPAYGYFYAFIELALGVAYLTAFMPVLTYTVTILVMGFSAIGVIRSVMDKQKIQCACLGTVFDLPMSTVTIVEDLSMIVMAAIMLGITTL